MPEMKIKVPQIEPKSYTITIGSNTLKTFCERIEADFPHLNKFLVTDENLAKAGHMASLLGGKKIPTHIISPAGEASKHIETVISIIEQMEQCFLGRDSLIIGLGGGTVGDIAGFAASIFKRGVPVVHIPTTTVAQADSAVGGKTGVDSTLSKNAFGTFWHPAAIYIDAATLKTLPDREYQAGLVESVKHALIADADYFSFIEDNIDFILARQLNVLEKMADYNCGIKGSVVEADPTEKNQRRMLNYGHTIGHAVESAGGYELLHGEAVAIGIIAAGLIEQEMSLGRPDRLERIKKLLKKLNQPTTLPENIDRKALIETIKRDKKAVNMWPKFILIDKMGSVHCQGRQWGFDVPQQLVEKVLGNL